jgi:hypothetical protein
MVPTPVVSALRRKLLGSYSQLNSTTIADGSDGHVGMSYIFYAVILRVNQTTARGAAGDDNITMISAGLNPSRSNSEFHQCVFTSSDGVRYLAVNATVDHTTSLTCSTPSWGSIYSAEMVYLTVMLTYPISTETVNSGVVEAIDLTPKGISNNQTFDFYQVWWNITSYPDPFNLGGDAAGQERVTAVGYGLDTNGEYQCAFSAQDKTLYSATVSPDSTTRISCVTPEYVVAVNIINHVHFFPFFFK